MGKKAKRDLHLWVCDCYLIENRRMVSEYLVLATGRRGARLAMQDGEHVVVGVTAYGDHVRGNEDWENLSGVEVKDLMAGKPVCLIAGT